jgi:hypothetical protein
MNEGVRSLPGMMLVGKLKYPEEKLLQPKYFHYKSHMDCPGMEPVSHSERPATNLSPRVK